MKISAKTERILYIAAALLSVLIIAVLLILLRSPGDAPSEPPVETGAPTPLPTAAPLPDGSVTIAGRTVAEDTDTFYLNGTALSEDELYAIAGLKALRTLSLTKCSLTDVRFLRLLPDLTTLYLSDNSISDLSPLTSLPHLRTLYLDRNPLTELSSLTVLKELTTLSLKGIALREEDVSYLRSCLPGCSVFDDAAADSVRRLSLGGLSFTAEDTVLDLSGRGISDISALSECTALAELNLSGNPLSGVGVLPNLSSLKVLNLTGTGLNDTALKVLSGMRQLSVLNIRSNPGITAEGLDALKSALPSCTIVHDEVYYKIALGGKSFMSDITELSLPYAAVSSLTGLEKCVLLETCDLSNNRIESLKPLHNSVKLKTLNLEKNRITSPEGLFPLTALEWLDLSDNYLTEVASLSGCTSLRWLDLSYNRLTDVTHLALCTNLQWLDLRGNGSVTREMADYLEAHLPMCQILTDLPDPTPEPENTGPLPPPGGETPPGALPFDTDPTPTPEPTPEPTPIPEPTPEPAPIPMPDGGSVPLV